MNQPDDLTTEQLFNLAYQHYTPEELAERDRQLQELDDVLNAPSTDAEREMYREYWQSLSEFDA